MTTTAAAATCAERRTPSGTAPAGPGGPPADRRRTRRSSTAPGAPTSTTAAGAGCAAKHRGCPTGGGRAGLRATDAVLTIEPPRGLGLVWFSWRGRRCSWSTCPFGSARHWPDQTTAAVGLADATEWRTLTASRPTPVRDAGRATEHPSAAVVQDWIAATGMRSAPRTCGSTPDAAGYSSGPSHGVGSAPWNWARHCDVVQSWSATISGGRGGVSRSPLRQ